MSLMKEKILIVDDIQANTQLIAAILEQNNYSTVEANNGYQALNLINEQDFDLVLLDIMMPEIDGIETCKLIKKDPKNKDLPIIFLSARHDKDVVIDGFKVGGHDYITKPFENEVLLIRLKTHIELRKSKEQLKKTHQELQQLNATKNGFLRLISQSLKQPISDILKINHLLKELVDSKELVGYITKLNYSVKQLEKFSSTALLLNDLKLNSNELVLEVVPLKQLIQNTLLQQSSTINSRNQKITLLETDKDMNILVEKKLLELALVKVIEAIVFSYKGGTQIKIIQQTDADFPEVIFEITGEYEDPAHEYLDINQNLPLMLAKLILELHSFELSIYCSASKKEYLKITFHPTEKS